MSTDSSDENLAIKGDIQKVLKNIDKGINELKSELFLLNNVIEEGGTLNITADLVNERLKTAAKELGIDLTAFEEDEENSKDKDAGNSIENEAHSSEDTPSQNKNGTQSSDASSYSTADTAKVVVAAKKITENIKRSLKK